MNNTNLQKSLNEYRKKFHEIYYNKVTPILDGMEIKRKSYLIKAVSYICLGLIIEFFITEYIWLNQPQYKDVLIIIGVFIGILFMLIMPIQLNKDYIKELKTYCLKPILDIFGQIQWGKNQIANTDLDSSDLFAVFNRRSNDDIFYGEYQDVKFNITETELGYETGSGKNRRYYKIFKGVIIRFKSNKTIKNKTIVVTKGDKNTKRNRRITILGLILILMNHFWLYNVTGNKILNIAIIGFIVIILLITIFGSKKDEEKMDEIKLEDPLFNKKFKAYSSDQVEGRYLITTAFMERFLNLNTAFGAKNAKCSFFGDNIMFAISSNKNLFELGNIFVKSNNPKYFTTFFNELASVLMLVDYFKLDEKTGL